ncbi:MAG: type II methionyl aminopeptidase [Conexivisphaera sp.]
MLSVEEVEKYVAAGRLAARALERARDVVEDGRSALEVCEELEEILWSEAAPAFPCNLSQGPVAAHYTPAPGDRTRIDGRSIVKVDLGAHVDGYISDTAISLAWTGANERLVEAARAALEVGISRIAPGQPLRRFGAAVEEYASALGLKPVSNLAGHVLGRFELHAGLSVPNLDADVPGRFEPWRAYALEPFLVPREGAGRVVDSAPGNIYRLVSRRVPKDRDLARVALHVWERYRGLPFASRWIARDLGEGALEHLRRLVSMGIVYEYRTLVEAGGAQVAQFEHTVLVRDSDVVVTTRRRGEAPGGNR